MQMHSLLGKFYYYIVGLQIAYYTTRKLHIALTLLCKLSCIF